MMNKILFIKTLTILIRLFSIITMLKISFVEDFNILFIKSFNVLFAEDFCTIIKHFFLNLIIIYIEMLMFVKDFESFDKIFCDRLIFN